MLPIEQFLGTIGSPNTRRAYRTDLCDFFDVSEAAEVELRRVETISWEDVRDYVRSLRADGKSVSTRRRRRSALRRFFDWAVEEGFRETNPARDARLDDSRATRGSSESARTPSVLSKSEIETLIQATSEAGEAAVRDRGLLLTIFYAALRRAEVAAMDIEHVRPLGRHWVIDLPSGSTSSSAYVKVSDTVVEAIDSVQTRYDIEQGALWRSLSNRNRGARMTPDAIYKLVRRTGRRAGLADVTVDAIRQSGLHLALKAGATMQQVQLHGRLKSTGSIERYSDSDERTGRLSGRSIDFVDLDLGE